MKRIMREGLPVFITCIYIIIISCVVLFRWSEFRCLSLNELGDFLAGAFGPLAFFWLVLGYLQQGKELKSTTKAVDAQLEELKRAYDAEFDVDISEAQGDAKRDYHTTFILKNFGADARNIRVRFQPSIGPALTTIPLIRSGSEARQSLIYGYGKDDESGTVFVSYIGKDGHERCEKFAYRIGILTNPITVTKEF